MSTRALMQERELTLPSCSVCFIVFLCDIEIATRFEISPFLLFSELDVELPSSDTLWNARSAHEWLALIVAPIHPAPISFLEAVQVLLSPSPPAPYDRGFLLLSELSKLSSFPLLILSRSLSFLQAKTEESIRQEDPFKSLRELSSASNLSTILSHSLLSPPSASLLLQSEGSVLLLMDESIKLEKSSLGSAREGRRCEGCLAESTEAAERSGLKG